MNHIEIVPRGPFSWAAAVDFLGSFAPTRHHVPATRDVIRITFPLDATFTPVAVALHEDHGSVMGEVVGATDMATVQRQVERIFSLDVDGRAYPEVGKRDPDIGRLMEQLPGLRPVQFTSPYECACWGIISQRIHHLQAAKVKEWLISEYGTPIDVAGATVRCFPTPEQMLGVNEIPALNPAKAERLRGVARAALEGKLDVGRLRGMGMDAAISALHTLPGIGDFWSLGIYLRACGYHDVFPPEPISIRALAALKGLPAVPKGDELERLVEPYQPFRMWVCVLLRVAAGHGFIPGEDGQQHRESRSGMRARR